MGKRRQPLVGDDPVCFTPDPTPDWIGWLEGTYPVPVNVGTAYADGATAMRSGVTTASGMFAYGVVNVDPVTIKMVGGGTFLPVLKVPEAVFTSTVKF